MATVTPHLPPELIDHIIAHVGDAPTLCSCCLVCSGWLHTSRRCLFRVIRINPDNVNLIVSRILQSDRLRPYLARVRELHINDSALRFKPTRSINIQEFAGQMPNLAVLSIRSLYRDMRPPHPSTFVAFSQFPAIRELMFSVCRFPSWSAFRRAMASLPSLTTLSLQEVWWPPPSSDLVPLIVPDNGQHKLTRMSLSSLYVTWSPISPSDRCCADDLFTWLSATPTPSSLRTFRLITPLIIRTHFKMDILALLSCVRLISTLRIHVQGCGADFQQLLPELVNLRRIELMLDSFGPLGWDRCSEILYTIRTPALLEAIEFHAAGDFLELRQRDDSGRSLYEGMEALDHLLVDGTPFKQVRRVILTLRHQSHDTEEAEPSNRYMSKDEAVNSVRGKLPRLLSLPFVVLRLLSF